MPSQQFEALVQMLRSRPRLADLTIAQQRVAFDELGSQLPVVGGTWGEPVSVGGVPGEWISAPGALNDRVVYYLRGGGYVIGSLASHRALISRVSLAAAARVLAIDYRSAPEHPFPAAVEDAVLGYRWLLATGVDPSQIVIAGDSGGGGLTIATLVALRDAEDRLPAAAVVMSPWVDLECTGASMTTVADADPIVTREWLTTFREAYLAGADPRAPLASPLYADLAGLPPLLIQGGSAEILLDDATRLAERAEAAGVDVTLDVWEHMFHFWQAFAFTLPEGQQALDRAGEFIRDHTPR